MTASRARIGKLDIAICSIASVLGVGGSIADHWGKPDTPLAAAPLFLAVTVPVLWRRAAPLAALWATLGGLALHVAIFGDSAIRCGIVLPVSFLLAFSAAARLDRKQSLIGLALATALDLIVCFTDAPTGADPSAMLFVGPILVAVWATGRLVHSRGKMVEELEARTSELREARDERARLEVADDRARVAAELDELLHRRLAELAQLADAGAGSVDATHAGATLVEIERESRRTLEEMRAVVGVLRSDGAPAPTAPQPTLTHLEAMLVRAKGPRARLKVEGSPRALPAGVELSAYRVVERLLDALEDAPDVEVGVRFADATIEIEVSGPMRRRGQHSIEQARERVRLENGTIEATTRGGRAETVVSLPIYAAV